MKLKKTWLNGVVQRSLGALLIALTYGSCAEIDAEEPDDALAERAQPLPLNAREREPRPHCGACLPDIRSGTGFSRRCTLEGEVTFTPCQPPPPPPNASLHERCIAAKFDDSCAPAEAVCDTGGIGALECGFSYEGTTCQNGRCCANDVCVDGRRMICAREAGTPVVAWVPSCVTSVTGVMQCCYNLGEYPWVDSCARLVVAQGCSAPLSI
jgi:hypothetical protein